MFVAPATVLVVLTLVVVLLMGVGRLRTDDTLTVRSIVPGRVFGADGGDGSAPLVTVHLRDSAHVLGTYFEKLSYRLAEVRDGGAVPPVFVSGLPHDLERVQPVERRKSLFLRSVLPLVLQENDHLLAARERLLGLRATLADGAVPAPADRVWLLQMYGRYGVPPAELGTLLQRVDIVPVSLALAQAAMESAWGTSRFLKEGNALFGMWTWNESIPGMVPLERDEDSHHRVRAFATLRESVRAYLHMLNTHWAYEGFRRRRGRLHRSGRGWSGLALAGDIALYSVQRNEYTDALRAVILGNDLQHFDRASLGGRQLLLAASNGAAGNGAAGNGAATGAPAMIANGADQRSGR